jgi:YHS domain-containing protein
MRRILFLSLLLSSAFGVVVLAARDQSPAAATALAPSTQEADKPVNKNCPIETDNAIDPKVTIKYKGKTIGFCCADCIKEFQKDPEKYLAKMK